MQNYRHILSMVEVMFCYLIDIWDDFDDIVSEHSPPVSLAVRF